MKRFLFTVLFILVFSSFANAITAEWKSNPVNENIYQYTLYYFKNSEQANIVKVNTPTTSVSIGGLEVSQTYVFYVTAWNKNNSGVPVESPQSDKVSYTIPLPPVDDREPDRPSGISLKLTEPIIEDIKP